MKYLPSRDLDNATSALNFTTSDCRVVGSCDLYATKAAGDDNKLYKNIDRSLQSQHTSLIRLSESLSPPNAGMFHLNLARDSPFGTFNEVSNRRTFAYLIATLNASHPDYDFSHFLRPSDFRREKDYKRARQTIDGTLYNVRPRPLSSWTSTPYSLPQTPGGGTSWSPRTWDMIDKEMTLRDCDVFRYDPQEDPFDDEESAIWSHSYFFFNKERRRVLYIHFRGLSPVTPPVLPMTVQNTLKRPRPVSRSLSFSESGAGKRAKYWFGNKADRCVSEPVWGEDAEDDECVIADHDDEEFDTFDAVDEDDEAGFSSADEDNDEIEARFRDRGGVRAVSEELAASIDL